MNLEQEGIMEQATVAELHQRRIERSESWIKKAEDSKDDKDASFIFWWIAFTALYDYENEDFAYDEEYIRQQNFFKKVIKYDEGNRIYETVHMRLEKFISTLIGNKYVFRPFWKHRNGHPNYDNWDKSFAASKRIFKRANREMDVPVILAHVFDRLYTLRNQIVHGGATHGSRRNRDSIEGGWDILSHLVPVFFDIIKANPDIDLGKPYFYADDV